MVSLEFDKEVNALYVKIRNGKVSSSEPLAENMTVDLDESGKIVGLELLLPAKIQSNVRAQIISLAKN